MTTHLRTLLGRHPGTAALKDGLVKSDSVTLDYTDFSPTNKGFKPMVRDAGFSTVSEKWRDRHLSDGEELWRQADGALLPNVGGGSGFQHGHALYNARLGTLKPSDLNGKRVGIRSFTTPTGAWLRGILANDYGVDLNSINWVTFEDAHVAEFRDTTARAPQGKEIIQMLLDGELDAVLGEKVERPGLTPLFPDAVAEEKAWFAKHGVLPINHMVVVSETLSRTDPDAVREVSRLLRESAARAPAGSPQFSPDEMRRSLELITRYTAQQGLIPRAYAVDELFDDLTRTLA